MQQPPNSNPDYPSYPPQQPYSQQPGYPQQPQPNWQQQAQFAPQPQMQSPKRKLSRPGCIIGTLAVLFVLAVIGAVAANPGGNNSPSPSTNTSSSKSSATATQPPTATTGPTSYKVGQAASLDSWTVTLNKAMSSQGSQYEQPQHSGDVFLLVSVTVQNGTGQPQVVSSIAQFTLKDSNGQKYDETIYTDAPSSPDGNLPNGQKLTGTIAFEVPGSIHDYQLAFTPSLLSTDEADWMFSV